MTLENFGQILGQTYTGTHVLIIDFHETMFVVDVGDISTILITVIVEVAVVVWAIATGSPSSRQAKSEDSCMVS